MSAKVPFSSTPLGRHLKRAPDIPRVEHSFHMVVILPCCMCPLVTWLPTFVALCFDGTHWRTPDAFCWAARSFTAMVTGNKGAVNALRRGNVSAFSPAVNLQDHRDWWKPPTCRGWTLAGPRDAQMRHRVTGGEGPAWCKSGKAWTHPDVQATDDFLQLWH